MPLFTQRFFLLVIVWCQSLTSSQIQKTWIKNALGATKGLTNSHDTANPPVIYRDMKAAYILLDNEFNHKQSDLDFKLGPIGDKTYVSTRVMGTYGYCAPDYAMSGKLNFKSDIYSFGVLLFEMITG